MTRGRHDGGQPMTYTLVVGQKEDAVVLPRVMGGVNVLVAVVPMAARLVGVSVVGDGPAQVDVDVVRLPFGEVVVQRRPEQRQGQCDQGDADQQPTKGVRRQPVCGGTLRHATIISAQGRAE